MEISKIKKQKKNHKDASPVFSLSRKNADVAIVRHWRWENRNILLEKYAKLIFPKSADIPSIFCLLDALLFPLNNLHRLE